MGASQSSQKRYYTTQNPFTGARKVMGHERAKLRLLRPGWWTQGKCASKPEFVDSRGFALSTIYGVKDLSKFPPTVYTLQMAQDDIKACAAGRDLVHYDKIVRYDKIVKSRDPREYALRKYHGYAPSDFPAALGLLPYTAKNAQVNIAHFQRTGKPYYKVVKATSTVIDPKRGSVRDWRHDGFDNKYSYDVYDPAGQKQRIGRLGNKAKLRFDASKYPLQKTRKGQYVRMVPCSVMPGMCAPGMKEFPYSTGYEKLEVAQRQAEAKRQKDLRKRALATHSQKMSQLRRRLAAAEKNGNSARAERLAAQIRASRAQASGKGEREPAPPPAPAKLSRENHARQMGNLLRQLREAQARKNTGAVSRLGAQRAAMRAAFRK